MPVFDWQKFLEHHRIEYTDRGRNVSKNNLALKCPWCGSADPSQHMNVSLKGYGYFCWRDATHRGTNNAKLIQKLLNSTWAEAIEVTGGAVEVLPDEDFDTRINRLLHGEAEPVRKLPMPKDWKRLDQPSGNLQRNLIIEYMKRRGYGLGSVMRLAKRYDIHYAMKDNWDRRVIWPLHDRHGDLVNYTGRAISSTQKIRYKTLSGDLARMRMSECLFDLGTLIKVKAEALVLTEGPFDAMRMGWIGEPLGIYSTCVFTQNVSETQAALLSQLAYRFERVFVLFDQGADLQSFRAASSLGFERIKLPNGVKDPDALSTAQAFSMCHSLLS